MCWMNTSTVCLCHKSTMAAVQFCCRKVYVSMQTCSRKHALCSTNFTFAIVRTEGNLLPTQLTLQQQNYRPVLQQEIMLQTFSCKNEMWPKPTPTTTATTKNSAAYNSHSISIVHIQSSGAVWKSRWPSWAVRPNGPYGFCGRKELLNRASALVTVCP